MFRILFFSISTFVSLPLILFAFKIQFMLCFIIAQVELRQRYQYTIFTAKGR